MEMEDGKSKFKKGTTVVAVKYGDMCVIAAERQVSGGFSITTYMKKLRDINEYVVAGGAGTVGDIQMLFRIVSEEADLYRLNTKKIMTADVAATKFSNVSRGAYGEFIIAGKNRDGVGIYLVDGAGAKLPLDDKKDKILPLEYQCNLFATGSGQDNAISILDKGYRELHKKEKVSEDDLAKLAADAIYAAAVRNMGCGGSIDLYLIDGKGKKKEYSWERIKELLEVS